MSTQLPSSHVSLLQGSAEVPINSTDCNYLFVQESYFLYLFGCDIPDAYGMVLPSGRGILFIPRYPEDYSTWMGVLPTPDSIMMKHGVEECYYVDELAQVLEKHGVTCLELLKGVNTDSGLTVKTAEIPPNITIQTSSEWLFDILSYQRCVKTSLEAEVLRYVCDVSSKAHITVMQACRPGMSQHQLESLFLHEVYYKGGCRRVSYTCICATGHHGATLHYPHNDAPVEDGTMALLDMGGNYRGYAADITCSFPVNGRFSSKQKLIYDAVLEAHDTVLRAMKPGVYWTDMHKLALRVMCKHLVRAGLLTGDVEELMTNNIMQFFQPHGLGHLLGIDVHDVGGYLHDTPSRPSAPDCFKLRTARALEEGFYMTVEPGCYFNHVLLNKLFTDPQLKKYANESKIREFWNFGGARIESDVLVTCSGVLNFTVVPRTVEAIERTMSGAHFTKEVEELKN